MAFFGRAADLAEADGDLDTRVAAVLGLARGQSYNLTPGLLPVRLHAAYERHGGAAPARPAGRGPGALLGVCERAGPRPALRPRGAATSPTRWTTRRCSPTRSTRPSPRTGVPTSWPGAASWAVRLDDAAAHLRDPDARLQAQLWGLTVAWEVLDLPRMHRCMRAIELLGEESPRARFFAASRRLPAGAAARATLDVVPVLVQQARRPPRQAVIPDADGVLHGMVGYSAFFAGDIDGCAAEAPGVRGLRGRARARGGPRRGGDDVARRAAARQGAPRWSGRSRPTCSPPCPATTTGCSPCSACSRVRSRSRTASSSPRRRPARAVRRPLGRQRRRGDVARRHRRHPGPGLRPAGRRGRRGPAPGGGAGDVRADRRHAGGATGWPPAPSRTTATRPASAWCTCTSSPAGCGWSAARERRSCCRDARPGPPAPPAHRAGP